MTDLTMRVYNVLFGDVIFLRVPDEDEHGAAVVRTVLIDCGNALVAAGDDAVFRPVLEDLRDLLAGEPLDLYVMTHEHMDHVQGLLFGARKLGIELKARQVWMTASSAPGYYGKFTKAKQKKLAADALLVGAHGLAAAAGAAMPGDLAAMLAVNNPRASQDCVDHIRAIGAGDPTYIHRTAALAGTHPFNLAQVRVLAPEEDTSIYYGKLKPPSLALAPGVAALAAGGGPKPPAGVAAGHFFDLQQFRATGMFQNLLAIDKAANNSSIVIELEWQGWRLLLPGDAEEKSWALMAMHNQLRPAHVLKVSHHGSHNGTPPEVLQHVLPKVAADARPRFAVVSTADGAYPGVPDPDTLKTLGARADLRDTRDLAPGAWFELTLPASGAGAGWAQTS